MLILISYEVIFFSLGVTAEELGGKTDPKSAFSLQRGQSDSKFEVEVNDPHQSFQIVMPINALQLCH